MKVEIWSDIMCPFCYIGKRKFESALELFEHQKDIEIEWRSFQLDPSTVSQPGKDVYSYLAERKGQTREWSVDMHRNVVEMAKNEGLEYNFDKAVIANSFNAHRLIQMAKQQGLGDKAEELLFKSYFTDGKNTDDANTLAEIGEAIGLDKAAVLEMLSGDTYTNEVNQDIAEAQHIGVRGVPFFVFDRRYAISGAQPSEAFLQTLQQAYSESKMV
ncbi:MAG: DsbA family oxidoreductase [Bacteroidota bacterium]